MKKITLKNLNLVEVEQLSREQLKDVLGGSIGITSTATNCAVECDGSNSSCVTVDCKPGSCSYVGDVFKCTAS